MISVILFDFGGTLDTDGIHWSEKFWDVYQALGVPITKEAYESAYVAAELEISQETMAPAMTFRSTLQKQIQYQIAYLVEKGLLHRDDTTGDLDNRIANRCYDDVLRIISRLCPLLDALKNNYSLGLVSNFTGNLATVCAEIGIDEYFPLIVDSAIVGVSKPNPEIFRIAVNRSGRTAQECVVVGDSYERDVVPGKAAGCYTIWLHGRSWKEPERTDQADYTINTIMDLPKVLEALNLPR